MGYPKTTIETIDTDEQTLKVTSAEVVMILSALATVAPSGGGSAPFSLMMKLGQQIGYPVDDGLIYQYANWVIDDAVDAGAIELAHDHREKYSINAAPAIAEIQADEDFDTNGVECDAISR